MSRSGRQAAPWSHAPLYVRAFDLARWFSSRQEDRVGAPFADLAARMAAEAQELLVGVGLALTFPATRSRSLERADEAVVRIRLLTRLARELGALSAAQARFVSDELDTVGRMIGGWRRAKRRRQTSEPTGTGVEAPRATGASCVAAHSGTMPTGAAPPTATTGTPGIATTTSGSASCCPPSPPGGARS